MSCTVGCCVFTRGELLIRDAVSQNCDTGLPLECDTGLSFKKLGNISSALVEIQGSILGRENEFNPADPESRAEILGVNLTLTLTCASTKNLLRALYGDEPVPTEIGFVEDFCITEALTECDFYPFTHKGVDPLSLVVYLRQDGEVVRTLVKDTDYVFTPSGVGILVDIDPDGADILRLAYTYDNESFPVIEFNSKVQKYKEIYFKGTNYGGDEAKLFDARFYRVLFAPVNQMDLITRDEFLQLTLVGTVEKYEDKWFNLHRQE